MAPAFAKTSRTIDEFVPGVLTSILLNPEASRFSFALDNVFRLGVDNILFVLLSNNNAGKDVIPENLAPDK